MSGASLPVSCQSYWLIWTGIEPAAAMPMSFCDGLTVCIGPGWGLMRAKPIQIMNQIRIAKHERSIHL